MRVKKSDFYAFIVLVFGVVAVVSVFIMNNNDLAVSKFTARSRRGGGYQEKMDALAFAGTLEAKYIRGITRFKEGYTNTSLAPWRRKELCEAGYMEMLEVISIAKNYRDIDKYFRAAQATRR